MTICMILFVCVITANSVANILYFFWGLFKKK